MQSFLSVKAEIWLGNAVYCFVYSDIIAFCIFKVSCILQCWHGCRRVRKQQVLTSVSAEGGSSHPLGTSQGSINQSFTYHCTLQLKIRDYRLHTWKSCPRVARWCKHRSWLIWKPSHVGAWWWVGMCVCTGSRGILLCLQPFSRNQEHSECALCPPWALPRDQDRDKWAEQWGRVVQHLVAHVLWLQTQEQWLKFPIVYTLSLEFTFKKLRVYVFCLSSTRLYS